MLRRVIATVVVLKLVLLTLLAAFVIGVRSGNPRFIRAVTRFQRDVVNPRVMRDAGTPGSVHAVIEHVGRTTGTRYETPIGAVRDAEDWVISLPYGAEASWVRNVLAAGEATLRVDGRRRRVGAAAVVPIVTTPIAQTDAAAVRLLGIRSALRLRDLGE